MIVIQLASIELFQIASSLDVEAMGVFSCNATTSLGSVQQKTRVTGILLCHNLQEIKKKVGVHLVIHNC